MRIPLPIVIGVLASMVVAAACGGDDEASTADGSDTTQASGPALEGTSWLLAPDSPLGVTIENIGVTAQFEDGTISGHSGCNQYNGPYEIDGSSLTIGPDLATTRIACPAPQTGVETAYLSRLEQTATYEIDGDVLVLMDEAGDTLLNFRVVEGVEAIQGAWTVTSYYAGTAVTSVLGGATLTADFNGDTVSGETGCNSFNGPVQVDGTDIEIGPLASTLTACTDEELVQQEAFYLEALELATSYAVAGTRLDLFREDGSYAVTFESS